MVNNMTPEMKKSLPKKMNLGRKTNGEISRTCFMLLRNQIKKSIVLVHYLLQFKTEQNAIDFVNGIQLLLKTRSFKILILLTLTTLTCWLRLSLSRKQPY